MQREEIDNCTYLHTVGELRKWLESLPDETPVYDSEGRMLMPMVVWADSCTEEHVLL